jgi:hypothetical protein
LVCWTKKNLATLSLRSGFENSETGVKSKCLDRRAEKNWRESRAAFFKLSFSQKNCSTDFRVERKNSKKKKRKQGSSPKKSAFLIIFCAQVSASETLVTPLTHLKYESTVDK